MKAATQRPRIARSWQVISSTDAASGEWTLVKGGPIKTKVVRIGRQFSQPHLPALSNVLRSGEFEKIPLGNGCCSTDTDELCFPSDAAGQTQVARSGSTALLIHEGPNSQLRSSVRSPSAESSGPVRDARLLKREEEGGYDSSHRSVRTAGFNGEQRSRLSSKRFCPGRAKDEEEEWRSKRQCLEAPSVEKGGPSMFQTASGKSCAVTSEMLNRARALLSEGDGLLQSPDQQLGLLQSEAARSVSLTAPGNHVPVVPSTLHSGKTLPLDENELQYFHTPWNCDNDSQIDATGSTGNGVVADPAMSRSPTAVGFRVSGANGPAEGGCLSMFTSGLGQKIIISDASIRRAEAAMERRRSAEVVSTEETAVPYEHDWKSKVSELAVRKALERLEASDIASPGHPVNDHAVTGPAPATSSMPGAYPPPTDFGLSLSTTRAGWKMTVSDAAIRKAGAILATSACGRFVQSKETLTTCESSWKSKISDSAVRRALERLEGSMSAKTAPSTRPSAKKAASVDSSELTAVARKQMGSRLNADHHFCAELGTCERCNSPDLLSEANLVTSNPFGHSQGAMQEKLSSTGKITPYAIQQRSKFPTLNQGCPIAAPFKPPRQLRELERQQGRADQSPVEVVICEGRGRVNMLSPFPKVSYPAHESLQEIGEKNACPEKPLRKLQLTMKEYYGHHPGAASTCQEIRLDKKVIGISAENATSFKVKSAAGDLDAEDFRNMLLKAGANSSYVTSQWVRNHYRWIIWKLASHERSFPQQAAGKYLSVQRVFSELLNRYRREYQSGHRSAVRRITERDSSAAQMMVLCISSTKRTLLANEGPDEGAHLVENLSKKGSRTSTIELTDGWYRIIATLDQQLAVLLQKGRMFVGQKLRICGAMFHGCTDGMPPLEAFSVSTLALHINGTFRTHWADTLGFCRASPIPLSLKCVKINGGKVAATIVVVNRVYPILFRERLKDGRSAVRCARAEDMAENLYNSRRSCIVDELEVIEEGYMQPSTNEVLDDGEPLLAQIMRSVEPEVTFANMTRAHRQSIADFQLKRQVATQMAAYKRVQEALEQADLLRRDVSSFLQIRVSEVCSRDLLTDHSGDSGCAYQGTKCKGGLLTIWNPSQDQIMSITEGAVYRISDLIALPDKSFSPYEKGLVHLRATKSSKWQELSIEAVQKLRFVFTPRFASGISTLDQIPDGGEFDIACIVLHVGEVKQDAFRLSQWIFVVDGPNDVEEPPNWMAIRHFASLDAFVQFESSMEGRIMGYCNLRKCRWDPENGMWVADASLSSEYSSKPTTANFRHLKDSLERLRKWASQSPSDLEFLRSKVIDEVICQ